jgi:hypothetical protein
MNIRASGRSALIITAGFCLCFAGPMRATESDARTTDSTAKTESASAPIVLTKQHSKKQATAHSRNTSKAAKSSDSKKTDDAAATPSDTAPANIPPSVANANAQLQSGDTAAADTARNMSAQADTVLKNAQQGPAPADVAAATTELVSADQLNEVDRSLSDDRPPPTLAMAVSPTASRVSDADSTWGQTSLIGKVFIAFGGLLTLASAARMFMA